MFPRVFIEAFWFMLAPTSRLTCGDMVFSGHTTFVSIAVLTFHTYAHPAKWHTLRASYALVLRRVVYALYMLALITIVATRLHYTLDVLIAFVLTRAAWNWYHTHATVAALKKSQWVWAWLEAEEVLSVDKEAYRLFKRHAKPVLHREESIPRILPDEDGFDEPLKPNKKTM
eukprot:GABV01003043.1.p1 GENE.GABV01003043.1~~GABV01003043.1.p1  ORF type:complete len:201 (-),score=50.61 GABV01003043.1:12-527(-)